MRKHSTTREENTDASTMAILWSPSAEAGFSLTALTCAERNSLAGTVISLDVF